MTRFLTSAAMAAALLAPAAAPATAPPPKSDLHLLLGYDGRLFIKVLDIEIDARADHDGFGAEAQLTSSGILALVKHVHQVASSQGRLVDGEPRPGAFETQNLGGKTHRKVRTIWSGGQVQMTAQPAFGSLGDPPASMQQELQSADPLTQLLRVALGGSRERTCNHSYLMFDGKQLYAVDLGPAMDASATPADQRFGLTGAFRCNARFREVAGFSKKPPEKRNQGLKRPIELRFARLGADGPLLITTLHADTPLGRGSIDLARMQISSGGRGRTEGGAL